MEVIILLILITILTSVIWNATNDYGKPVSAGIYLYQIQAGEYISNKKMVLLK